MNNNIYLDLELFLDPAITDAAAMKERLKEKIKDWNKRLVAKPELKNKVRQANEWINSGLNNLQKQAEEARMNKLKILREKIGHYQILGEIDEDDMNDLIKSFQSFFTETTIRREATGNDHRPSIPTFQEPIQPDSLKCKVIISYLDIKQITEWLKNVKNGQCNNLYEFLGSTPTETTQALREKSQEASDLALKIPKTNLEADYLNKICGKCLLYFKNEENHKGYDTALKRFSFDKLGEDKFAVFAKKFAKNNETKWDIYQQSIHDTIQLGYSQEEASWLVFDFFCNKKKCLRPIPVITKTPPFNILKTIKNIIEKILKTEKNLEQIQRQGFFSRIKKAIKQLWHNLHTPPKPTTVEKPEDQFDSPELKEFLAIKKKFQSRMSFSVLELSIMFSSLEGLWLKKTTLPNHVVIKINMLRANVAEKLAEMDYKQRLFDRALRCYNAVLDCNPYESLARARKNFIENFKSDLFSQLNTFAAQNNAAACTPIIAELHEKFPTDHETNDFCRKIENQLANIPLPVKEELQKMIDEKQWYKINQLLSAKSNNLPRNYQPVLERAQQILQKTQETTTAIRETLQANPELAQTQLYQLKKIISDYPEFNFLIEELEAKKNHSSQLESELQILCQHKHWIQAENQIRKFLSLNPVKLIRLGEYVQKISIGVENYQNKLRLWLFSIFGLPVCGIFTWMLIKMLFPHNNFQFTSSNSGLVFFCCYLGCYLGLNLLLLLLRKKSETPHGMAWYFILLLYISISISDFIVQNSNSIFLKLNQGMQEKMQGDDSFNPERFELVLGLIFIIILPFFLTWFATLGHLLFFYSFIQRTVCRNNFYPLGTLLLISGGVSFIRLLPEDRLFGLHHNSLIMLTLIWTILCWIVFRDYRKNLDASFDRNDFKEYLQRRTLIAKLRKNKNDLGQISLLETNWYQEIEKITSRQQQQTPVTQSQQTSEPFIPTPPPIQKISMPGTVPVPPVMNHK
ncbi:MAG: hypothetical protein LBJ67_13300 [Planctomycetaceae bacterium]|jgi:hypothetical protein|nr:hypothetical protein [Planctomycetaceae bacterium]